MDEQTRIPCAQCPFRCDSPLAYDSDAITALDEGHEPSCHAVVGLDAVFAACHPQDEERCIGFDLWLDQAAGFRKPVEA